MVNVDWEMVKQDQGYVGQPNKICMKYELGVRENQFEAKTRARARGETIYGLMGPLWWASAMISPFFNQR